MYVWVSHVTVAWVMSHMNESCHTWMSHITCEWVKSHMNEPCHTWMSHATHTWVMSHMNESCHIWMSHVTYEWVMLHLSASRCTRSHVTRKSWWCRGVIWRHLGDVGWQVGVRWWAVGLLWHEVPCTCLLMIHTAHITSRASRLHVSVHHLYASFAGFEAILDGK